MPRLWEDEPHCPHNRYITNIFVPSITYHSATLPADLLARPSVGYFTSLLGNGNHHLRRFPFPVHDDEDEDGQEEEEEEEEEVAQLVLAADRRKQPTPASD